jgi:hypothetical protein
MGTSRSFRSPATPRWRSVLGHIASDDPHELIRAELFNAGVLDGWNTEFGRPGISVYVEALVEAHGGLGDALREAERPQDAIEQLVSETRQRALRTDAAPTLAIAERALTRTLLGTVREGAALSTGEPDAAGEAWDRQRGTPGSLVSRFLGEVLHQFTCHVVARDAGQIVGRGSYEGARSVRLLERALARDAQQIASTLDVAGAPGDLAGRWPSLVDEAFRRAAAPPAGSDG